MSLPLQLAFPEPVNTKVGHYVADIRTGRTTQSDGDVDDGVGFRRIDGATEPRLFRIDRTAEPGSRPAPRETSGPWR